MSASIKVCARARPPLKGELTDGKKVALELETGSEASVRILRDGEPKCFFSRVWGMNSTQEEIFEAVGRPAVTDVMQGFNATIFVYGQTGTGKTYTLGCTKKGCEGIQPRAIDDLFARAKAISNENDVSIRVEYIQLYRDSILDLLDTAKDRLNIRVDEKGEASIEGNTCVEVSSEEHFRSLVQLGDKNRAKANTRLNSSSSRSHSCLITTVESHPKGGGAPTRGKLYLIDLAGSERVAKSGATGEAYREAVAINKSLTVLGTCVHGIVNGERHIPFRDSKLTRMLQHCLSGNGRTTVIVTIHPLSEHISETSCTLRFGERAMKVQAQMTISDYKEKVDDLFVKIARQEEAYAGRAAELKEYQRLLQVLEEKTEEKVKLIEDYEANNELELDDLRKELGKEHSATLQKYQQDISEQRAAAQQKVAALRAANKEKLQGAGKRQQEAQTIIAEATEAFKRDQEERLERVKAQGVELSKQAEVEMPDEERIKERLSKAREEVAQLRFRIRDCTPSPHAHLSVPQLRRKLAKLRQQKVSLSSRLRDLTYVREDQMRTRAARGIMQEQGGYISQSDAESDETATASSGSTADLGVSEQSSSSIDLASSYETETEETELGGAGGQKGAQGATNPFEDDREHEEQLFRTIESRYLRDAVRKEASLQGLIEQILQYLEYGCPVWRVTATAVSKVFLYLDRSRQQVHLCQVAEDGKPRKKESLEILSFSEIKDVILGQFSPEFMRHAVEGNTPPPPDQVGADSQLPPPAPSALHRHFYRSFSIKHKKRFLNLIAGTETDFEAWVVTLHRITTIDPQWGEPLDISGMDMYNELQEAEKHLCSTNHITPKRFLSAKESVLSKDRLYVTLYDIRTLSDCDLLHSQKLFEFFTKQKWVQKHAVWMLKRQKNSMLQTR